MSVSYNPTQYSKGAKALLMMETALQGAASLVDRIATYVTSDTDSEDYAWMGEAPMIEEAEDELKFKPMSDTKYTLTNKKYWGGIAFKREEFEDGKVGGHAIRLREFAQQASRLPNKLLSQALINGTSATLGKCYDGGAFFTATHPARGDAAAYSNLLTGAGTSTAQIQTDLNLGLAALLNMVGENGEPLNEGFTKLFVVFPPAIMRPMLEAISAPLIANTSNVGLQQFSIDPIPNPRLTSDSTVDWYMGIQDVMVRGLVFQDREATSYAAQDGAEHDASFTRDEYRYKVRRRCIAGYGKPQRLLKINNT